MFMLTLPKIFNIRKTCPCKVYPIKPKFYTFSKTVVCRGIPIFLIFAPKHGLWVLVRTASAIYVLSKKKKKKKKSNESFQFLQLNENLYSTLHGHVFVMNTSHVKIAPTLLMES